MNGAGSAERRPSRRRRRRRRGRTGGPVAAPSSNGRERQPNEAQESRGRTGGPVAAPSSNGSERQPDESKEPRGRTGGPVAAPSSNGREWQPDAAQEPQAQEPQESWFGGIKVSGLTARALESMGYQEPTSIQGEVIPLVQSGRDVVGQAQTGTGKTAAFGIPLVEMLDPSSREIQALVLTPTRELAMQVREDLFRIGQYRGVRTVAIYGGQAMSRQLTALEQTAHIVVGTPGRLMDHMERGTVRLDRLKIAVLDEADQMLDIGFAPDIEYILRRTPRSRQTLLFSATMPVPIKRLASRYLKSPAWVRVGGDAEPVDEVQQVYYEVSERERPSLLDELLRDKSRITQALVFRRTRMGVDRLESFLRRRGHDAQAIHGDMSQAQRSAVMRRFRAKELRTLVATNVAARGLDIPAISHVINFDMPDNLEEYVHRIGRTARMGKTGTAIIFVSEWDFPTLDLIQAHVGDHLRPADPLSLRR